MIHHTMTKFFQMDFCQIELLDFALVQTEFLPKNFLRLPHAHQYFFRGIAEAKILMVVDYQPQKDHLCTIIIIMGNWCINQVSLGFFPSMIRL